MTFEISKGKYLLDANTFIRPYRSFYKMERFPSYWKWLEKQRESGIVLPRVVYNELTKKGQDPLSQWVIANFQALIFDDYENNLDGDIWNYFDFNISGWSRARSFHRHISTPGTVQWKNRLYILHCSLMVTQFLYAFFLNTQEIPIT